MLRRPALALLSSLVGLSALVATAPPAPADGKVPLDLAGFREIVVDDTHGRVFLSQGTDQVLVTDLDGQPTGVVEGLYGAEGLVLSQDDSTLFVGMTSGDAVGVVDTESLAVRTLPTGPQTCPGQVELAADLVWFEQSCGAKGIGAVDPVDGSVHLSVADLPDAQMTTSPALPGEMFVATGSTTYAMTVTGGDEPALTERLVRDSQGWTTADFAVTPDGARLVTSASMRNGEAAAFRTSDFSGAGNYLTGDYPPIAIAVRDDGMIAFGTYGTYEDDVYVMPPGSTTPLRRYEIGYDAQVAIRGLAFGDTRLYAVERVGDRYRLQVITPRRVSAIEVHTDRTTYAYDEVAEVEVALQGGSDSREVQVWATPVDGDPVLVDSGEVPAGGTFTARYPVTRATSFSATYAGDEGYDPDEDKTKPVKVQARFDTVLLKPARVQGKYSLYPVGRKAVLRATMTPVVAGRCVTVRVQYLVRGSWGYDGKTDCLTIDRRGRVQGYVTGSPGLVGMPLRMHAEFRGDKVHTATTSGWRYLKFTR